MSPRALARKAMRPGLPGLALLAAMQGTAAAGPGDACREQAALAERVHGIPSGLLLAIGKRESGRFDPEAGGVLPWPWAVNREGEDRYFTSPEEAIAYVAASQGAGSRSIDVGCFQINLKYHPQAFGSLAEAFDPAANAVYAARFLTQLHGQTGSWETAVAQYHSADPWRGVPYQQAVFATWQGTATAMPAALRPVVATGLRPAMVVRGIRVWTPGSAPAGNGLPRVITP
ncbi:Lytic transglycosylase domain-containing protein [Rhodovastum atsumiense]|uniref:Lytic transglycosylase domain-containing protein n=1 Tax=Rhodovastum atsumiense TaxID=504468 RepID=A0A5M6J2R6_9PROT|nr:transglycosylase SLT domain-containing protein [Rhodovastum atsumiense]KAA5613888.1 lytic transglycosylase domain-containing protein [Rhodovastum atsumiense]CAH2602014.1 Lytic transglycosylase domain-containing protein [Rhodovastum atsumiense]